MNNLEKDYIEHILQFIKIVPVLAVLGGLFVFQVDWIQSAQNIKFQFDFSAYHELMQDKPEISERGDDLESFIQNILILSNISEPNINLSAAEDFALNNNTLKSMLSEVLNYSGMLDDNKKINASLILSAFQDGVFSGDEDLIRQFLHQVWNISFSLLIPSEWLSPISLDFYNEGHLNLEKIAMTGIFQVEKYNTSFVLFNESTTTIPPGDNFHIEISMENIVRGLGMIFIDDFVNYSIQLIMNKTVPTLNSFFDHFEEVLINSDMIFILTLDALFGIFPTNVQVVAEITTIITSNIDLKSSDCSLGGSSNR